MNQLDELFNHKSNGKLHLDITYKEDPNFYSLPRTRSRLVRLVVNVELHARRFQKLFERGYGILL